MSKEQEPAGMPALPAKARLIVLDIETYRTRNPRIVERVTREAIEKRPAQNTLKELKLEWDTFAARETRATEALAKTAVDVLLAEVVCVCWTADGEKFGLGTHTDLEEAATLKALAELWQEQAGPETIWCGHNAAGFDLAVLLNRWRHHLITPPEHFPKYINGKWRGRVFDTMLRTPCKNGLGFISLENVCEAYGVEIRSVEWKGAPMDGSRVGEAFEAGEHAVIAEYCLADVDATISLYQRMTCRDTWGTYDAHADVAEQVTEIEQNTTLSDAQKALAIFNVLDGAGLVPRVA